MDNSSDDSFFEDFVWVQMKGYCPWPAKIIPPQKGVPVKEGHFRVYFFGTQQTAYVSESRMWPYLDMKYKFINDKSKKHKGFSNGIVEIENTMKDFAEKHKNSNDFSSTTLLTNGESDSSSEKNETYPENYIPVKENGGSPNGSVTSSETNSLEHDDIPLSEEEEGEREGEYEREKEEYEIEDDEREEEVEQEEEGEEEIVELEEEVGEEEQEEVVEEGNQEEQESSDGCVTPPAQNSFDDGPIPIEEAAESEDELNRKQVLRPRRLRYSRSSSRDVREEISPNHNLERKSMNEEEIDLDLINRLVSDCYFRIPIVKLDRISLPTLPASSTHKHIQNVDDSVLFTQHRKRRHSLSEKQTPPAKRRRHRTQSALAAYPELWTPNLSPKRKSKLHIHIGSNVYREPEVVDKETEFRNRLVSECYTRIPVVILHKIPLSELQKPRNSRNRAYSERRRHLIRNSRFESKLKSQIPVSNVEPELRKDGDSDISERLKSECLSKHIPQVRIEVMSKELIARLTSQPPPKPKIGILGSGVIGKTVVELLLKSGYHISVWDRYKSEVLNKPDTLRVRYTISQIMEDCDIVVCCLTDTKEVIETVYRTNVLDCIEGKRFINCTITDPEVSLNLNEAIESSGGQYFECPLLPSKSKESKRMLGLVSGDKEIICNSSCLHAISEDMFYLGEIPYANKMACVVSSFSGTAFAAIAEGLAFAYKVNLNGSKVLEILEESQFGAQMFLDRGRALINGNYKPKMYLKNISKEILLSLFTTSDIPMPVTAMARQVYLHTEKEYKSSDICAIREFFIQKLKQDLLGNKEESTCVV